VQKFLGATGYHRRSSSLKVDKFMFFVFIPIPENISKAILTIINVIAKMLITVLLSPLEHSFVK
jgi:hypothetical protein